MEELIRKNRLNMSCAGFCQTDPLIKVYFGLDSTLESTDLALYISALSE